MLAACWRRDGRPGRVDDAEAAAVYLIAGLEGLALERSSAARRRLQQAREMFVSSAAPAAKG